MTKQNEYKKESYGALLHWLKGIFGETDFNSMTG